MYPDSRFTQLGKKFVYQVVKELDKTHRANDQPGDFPGE